MRYLLVIAVILTHFSCKKDIVDHTNHIIKIDLDMLGGEPLPDLKINSTIQLEINESSLVGNVNRIEWHNGKVYILDVDKSKALYAFSEEGAFIGKTKYGRGPGELINPFDLYLDKGSNLVYVWDQSLKLIMKYSSTLEYLGQEVFNHPLTNFAILDNNKTLIHTHYSQDFVYKLYGPDNETVEKEFIPDIKYPGVISIFRSISIKDRVLVIAPYQYDIYKLKDGDLYSVFYVDFGKYNLTREDIEQNGMHGSWNLTSEGKRVSSLHDISEGESFLSFRVYFKSEALDFAYSFKDQKPYLINEYVGKNMLPPCTVRGIAEDDLFYAVVEPEDLDNFQKETGKILIEGEIDPESNPYIITFKLDELVKN